MKVACRELVPEASPGLADTGILLTGHLAGAQCRATLLILRGRMRLLIVESYECITYMFSFKI